MPKFLASKASPLLKFGRRHKAVRNETLAFSPAALSSRPRWQVLLLPCPPCCPAAGPEHLWVAAAHLCESQLKSKHFLSVLRAEKPDSWIWPLCIYPLLWVQGVLHERVLFYLGSKTKGEPPGRPAAELEAGEAAQHCGGQAPHTGWGSAGWVSSFSWSVLAKPSLAPKHLHRAAPDTALEQASKLLLI